MRLRIALAAALVAAVAGTSASIALASSSHSQKRVASQKVTVTMLDYRFKLSKKTVKKGVPVVFTVINKGKTVHNFDLQGVKASPIAGPGSKKVLKVTFKKAGKQQYVCDVPRHAELGMTGTLTVK